MLKNRLLIIIFFILPLLTACGPGGPAKIEVDDAVVLEAKVSPVSAGDLNFSCICDTRSGDTTSPVFMTIRNRGGEPDRLLSVETEGAVRVSLSKRASDDADITISAPVDTIEIAPRDNVAFDHGEYYMLLTGLKNDLVAGQELRLTLNFEKTGPLTVDAVINPRD